MPARAKIWIALSILQIAAGSLPGAGDPIKTLELGAKAPDFRLQGVDGRWYTLQDFAAARFLVVVFTCNHCPTAQNYEERLKGMVTGYSAKGVRFVAISPNAESSVKLSELGYTDVGDSFAEMKIRAAHREFNFPYLYEGDKTGISRAYGPTATPHAFVFDAERKLRYVGRIDDSEREPYVKVRDLRNALDALLAGTPVPVAQTRAFGCSIKWSDKTEANVEYLAAVSAEPVSVELAGAEDLKALRKNASGKLRLVNFWATWCAPCVEEFPQLVAINRMYRNRAFEMITVAANYPDEKNQVMEFLRKQRSSGRNLLFGDTDKYKLMEAFDKDWNAGLPYTVLISPAGEYLYKVQGPIDALELKRTIVKALVDDRAKPKPGRPLAAFRSKLLSATTRHLDLLLGENGNVASLKGKSSDAMTASAFSIAYALTGERKYRLAAVQLADRIVKAMRATKFGVLYIKQKEKGPGKEIPGGGPPAFGWYTSVAAHILHGERGREADLKYIATVLDNFPWNEEGWWSADIDVNTGESKQPLTKPSPINKNVAVAMAAARLSLYIRDIDPALAARLSGKAQKCIYRQVIPAQEPDGFWHYGLTGNDPNNKDILGYFMVTMDGLIQMRQYTDSRSNPVFLRAMEKAGGFAARCIAPVADPNHGPACRERTTPATPSHYTVSDDPRRGFQLGLTLVASRNYEQATRVMNETLKHFPYGDTGAEGSHAVHPCALMLLLMSEEA